MFRTRHRRRAVDVVLKLEKPMLEILEELAPKALCVLLFFDFMFFLCGLKSVTGWILDKLGL